MKNPDNRCTNSGALTTADAAETVYDTTVAIDYSVNGKAYQKATVADGATPTTDGNTGDAFVAVLPDRVCTLVWGLNAAGTVSLYQGPIQVVDGNTDVAKIYPQFPSIPDTITPFAYTIFQTDGTSSAAGLLPGTANWNATGLTVTTVNVLTLPNRPQIS